MTLLFKQMMETKDTNVQKGRQTHGKDRKKLEEEDSEKRETMNRIFLVDCLSL